MKSKQKKIVPEIKKECFVGEDVPDFHKAFIRQKVCQDLPVVHKSGEHSYCILHFPDLNKTELFNKEFGLRIKNSDYNFQGIYFPTELDLGQNYFRSSVDFHYAVFNKTVRLDNTDFAAEVSFCSAQFLDRAVFVKTSFFGNASFWLAYFDNSANFYKATFSREADFNEVIFKDECDFSYAFFDEKSKTSFQQTFFHNVVSFNAALINGYLRFDGGNTQELKDGKPEKVSTNCFDFEESHIEFQHSLIDKPEKISFHSVRLQPHWFVNVDCRKFVFTNCFWQQADRKKIHIKKELESLKDFDVLNPTILLTKACRQLANNFEESKSFKTASFLRQIAMESKRVVRFKGFRPWTIHWWYWLTSFYGESWKRASVVLFTLLAIFAVGYTQSTFYVCPPDIPISQSSQQNLCESRKLNYSEAIRQSLASATFQNVEYRKPITERSELFILLEKIFAPIQAALLALAIRRKFMS